MWNFKNTRKQGDAGLGSAIEYFTLNGYTVCVPLTDNDYYDLVVSVNDGPLLKVQIKTSRRLTPNNTYQVQLRTLGGNQSWSGVVKYFNPSNIDLLFILCENGDRYLIPTKNIVNTNTITVGKKYTEYLI